MTVSNLNGALLVKVYGAREDQERVYAWFGSSQIHVYNSDLCEVDVFTNYDLKSVLPSRHLSKSGTLHRQYEDEHFMRAPHTNTSFMTTNLRRG